MKGNNKLLGAFRGLTILSASILTIAVGLSVGAMQNETDINENLGTASRVFVQDKDNARFKSDYADWKAMTEAKANNIRATAEEGIVLLQNDGTLPLSNVDRLNIFGRNSADPALGGGGGAGKVSDPNCVSVKDGFKKAGFSINETLYDYYGTCEARKVGGMRSAEYSSGEVNPSAYPSEVTNSLSQYGDTAIIWLTRCIGEGTDPAPGFMEFDENEKALIRYVEGLSTVRKIVVVLNEDNPIGVAALKNDSRINAIIHAGGLGLNGTEALANIIKGKTNPSGHLVDTYAMSSTSSAAAQNIYDHSFSNADEVKAYVSKSGWSDDGATEYAHNYIAMKEGIYVGYRYYETRYEDQILNRYNATSDKGVSMGESAWDYDKEVAWSFGHGLSYTTFEQTLNSVKVSGTKAVANVTIKNTGSIDGKSTVQFYAQSPYTQYDRENLVEKSSIQLIGFEKVNVEAGKSVTIDVEADLHLLASYDYTKAKTYIMDDGDYYYAIGDDAHDALNNVIAAKDSTKSTLGKSAKAYKYHQDKFDSTTYSTSQYTDEEITNLFDRADYNYFHKDDGKAYKYLTRQDWTTFPTNEGNNLVATTEMMKELSGQADKWDNHDYSNGDYDGVETKWEQKNDHSITEMYGNTNENDPLWEVILQKMSKGEAATFTEGNSLTRPIESLGYTGSVDGDGPAGFSGTFGDETSNPTSLSARVYQTQCMLASTWNKDLAYKEGSFMGEDGLYLGKTSIWAPGVNLHRSPYSARNFEYYSEDSVMAYWMGANQCKGMQDKGNIACPKHFAFNDQEKNRCSLVNFINEQEARELQLRCFEGSFTKGGALGTMTSFSRIGLTYAGESHELLTDVLRDEWGFKGYTVTDYAAWNFMHPIECVKAGTDMFDTTGQKYTTPLLEALEKGNDPVLEAATRVANKRVLYAYCNSHAVDGTSYAVTPWWKTAIYAIDWSIGVITGGIAIAYGTLVVLKHLKSKKED